MSLLKETRTSKNLTQEQACALLGVSLRSYKSYENDEKKHETIKYKYILEQLAKINFIDEDHGVLAIEDIRRKCAKVFEQYEVKFCYLFGSYAKGKETPQSDQGSA